MKKVYDKSSANDRKNKSKNILKKLAISSSIHHNLQLQHLILLIQRILLLKEKQQKNLKHKKFYYQASVRSRYITTYFFLARDSSVRAVRANRKEAVKIKRILESFSNNLKIISNVIHYAMWETMDIYNVEYVGS